MTLPLSELEKLFNGLLEIVMQAQKDLLAKDQANLPKELTKVYNLLLKAAKTGHDYAKVPRLTKSAVEWLAAQGHHVTSWDRDYSGNITQTVYLRSKGEK